MEDEPKTAKRKLVLAGVAAVVAVVLGGLVVLSPSGASDLATVRPLEPTVRLRQPMHSVFKPITAPVATNEGAAIETDKTGMAEIDFFDGSLTRLGVETEYQLSTLEEDDGAKGIVGDLEIGRTFHRVTKLTGSEEKFEVRTANAVASVRGTRFVVICLVRDVCEIGVIDGLVEVTSRITGEKILLRPGQEITIFADGSLSEIRPLDLDDSWVSLNLQLDDIDVADLQKRLFGDDRLPATDDDPSPDEVDGDGDGQSDTAADGGTSGSRGDSGTDDGSGGDTGGGDEVLGEVVDRPADGEGDPPGQGSTTTTSPGQGNTTTTRPGQGSTTTTRPGQGSTTTTRPQGTTTTRPNGTTSTTRPPGTTSTTCGGYPPTCG